MQKKTNFDIPINTEATNTECERRTDKFDEIHNEDRGKPQTDMQIPHQRNTDSKNRKASKAQTKETKTRERTSGHPKNNKKHQRNSDRTKKEMETQPPPLRFLRKKKTILVMRAPQKKLKKKKNPGSVIVRTKKEQTQVGTREGPRACCAQEPVATCQ